MMKSPKNFFEVLVNPGHPSTVHVDTSYGNQEMRQMMGSGALLEEGKRRKGQICVECHLEISAAENPSRQGQTIYEKFLLLGQRVRHTECP